MFASTAIPIVRITPAIPGRVNVTSNAFKARRSSNVNTIKAQLAAIPDTRKTIIISTIMIAIPIIPAIRLVLRASCPSCAPTTFE